MSRLLGAGTHKSSSSLLAVSFNQDASCLSVGTRKGYSIWNTEPHGRVFSKNVGPTGIVEMLFCTSLVALVGTGEQAPPGATTAAGATGRQGVASPRKVQVVNSNRQSTICELLFPSSVLGVKLNRKRLVVLLEEEIYIYDISNMKLLHTIETSPNPQAICALSASSNPCYLVFPSPVPSPTSPLSGSSQAAPGANGQGGYSMPGDIMIFDLLNLSMINIIQAHKAPIAALALNANGTLLATASEKGTIIRVFSIPSATKLWQFRRGSYPARIYSLSFNATSTLLSCSSDTETVHIFRLAPTYGEPEAQQTTKLGTVVAARNAALSAAAGSAGTLGTNGNGTNSPAASLDDDESEAGNGFEESAALATRSGSGSGSGSSAGGAGGGFKGLIKRQSRALGRNVAGSVGGLLPHTFSDMWEVQRDFAHLKLPTPGVSSIVAISPATPTVMVVTSEGCIYTYSIDLEHGGECVLMKQYSLLDYNDDAADER